VSAVALEPSESPTSHDPAAAESSAESASTETSAESASPESSTESSAESASWARRRLCPDESCIGVLDAHGVCKLCGKRDEQAAAAGVDATASEPADDGDDARDTADDSYDDGDDDFDDESEAAADDAESLSAAARSSDSPGFADDLENRTLCPDESCIGVLDESGRCKVCGARAARSP